MSIIMKTGGGGGKPNVLTVSIDTGATVTATGNGKVVSGVSVDGKAVLKLPKPGVWSIFAELDGQTTEDVITISDDYPIEVPFGLPLNSLAVGSLVRVKESGADVNYRIVHQGLPSNMYDASCNGTWGLREAIHSNKEWDLTNNDYQNSDIHTFLNGTFLGLFDGATQTVIKQIKIPYVNGTGGSAVGSGSNGLNTKIFLLSGYEVGWTTSTHPYLPVDGACLSYFSGTSAADPKRIGYYEGTAATWWLRSPNNNNNSQVWNVHTTGDYSVGYDTNSLGIRPAMVFEGTKMVNPKTNADGSYTLML